jgi:6-pyruvoyltetrahydropterin/6-carboxytetrahydropterin synthase
MITITRKLEFDAGHRVHQHESKCGTLHGHRYVLEVTATAPELDGLGRVIDFSVLKEKIGTWIDTYWDHTTLVYVEDKITALALEGIPKFKPTFLCTFNPTAENMAHYLLHEIIPSLMAGTGVTVNRLKLWETPNCFAEVTL